MTTTYPPVNPAAAAAKLGPDVVAVHLPPDDRRDFDWYRFTRRGVTLGAGATFAEAYYHARLELHRRTGKWA